MKIIQINITQCQIYGYKLNNFPPYCNRYTYSTILFANIAGIKKTEHTLILSNHDIGGACGSSSEKQTVTRSLCFYIQIRETLKLGSKILFFYLEVDIRSNNIPCSYHLRSQRTVNRVTFKPLIINSRENIVPRITCFI